MIHSSKLEVIFPALLKTGSNIFQFWSFFTESYHYFKWTQIQAQRDL